MLLGARIVNTVRKIRAKTKKANEENKSRKSTAQSPDRAITGPTLFDIEPSIFIYPPRYSASKRSKT